MRVLFGLLVFVFVSAGAVASPVAVDDAVSTETLAAFSDCFDEGRGRFWVAYGSAIDQVQAAPEMKILALRRALEWACVSRVSSNEIFMSMQESERSVSLLVVDMLTEADLSAVENRRQKLERRRETVKRKP